jgi:hypothetical protein
LSSRDKHLGTVVLHPLQSIEALHELESWIHLFLPLGLLYLKQELELAQMELGVALTLPRVYVQVVKVVVHQLKLLVQGLITLKV